jgi:PspA associated protein B
LALRDVLFGRKKLKDPARERLFAISTARITLETELDLKPAGAAGVCFKSLSAGEFVRAENELQQLLDAVAVESGSKVERTSDEYGFEWLVVRDGDFEDLVTSVHLVASELESRGFGPQLLAAMFPFEGKFKEGRRVYWIYGFKGGAFWPFVPTGKGQERDNAEELELKAKLEQELPIEQDLTRWFGLFNAPL